MNYLYYRNGSGALFLLLVGAVALALLPASVSSSHLQEFETTLSGAEEVPPVETESEGQARITIDAEEGSVGYSLSLSVDEEITAAHLHCAPKGQNGPAIVTLYEPGNPIVTDRLLQRTPLTDSSFMPAGADCPTPVTDVASLLAALLAGEIYVNVHSTEHPDGLIRGQFNDDDGADEDENGEDGEDGEDGEPGEGGEDGEDSEDGEDPRSGRFDRTKEQISRRGGGVAPRFEDHLDALEEALDRVRDARGGR